MSRKRWFWVRGLAALFTVVAIVIGGFVLYRVSWSQGYQAGQLATGTEGELALPYMHPRFGYPGGLFSLGMILLVFVLVSKALRTLFWTSMIAWAPRPRFAYRRRRFYRHGHHPMGPWFCDWEEPGEKDESEPAAGADEAES